MPLWSAYLVKAFAWRGILSEEGVLNWALDPLGISGPGYGLVAVWLVMSYIWLPYMIIPIYAGLERIPDTLLSGLGGPRREAGLHVPPGDPAARASPRSSPARSSPSRSPSATSSPRAWSARASSSSAPSSATTSPSTCHSPPRFAMVPIVIMIVYLLIARRLGAFEHSMRLSRRSQCAAADRRPGSRSRSSTCRWWSIVIYAFSEATNVRLAAAGLTPSTGSTRRSTTPAPATRSGTR